MSQGRALLMTVQIKPYPGPRWKVEVEADDVWDSSLKLEDRVCSVAGSAMLSKGFAVPTTSALCVFVRVCVCVWVLVLF